jgi:pimeloyl-[acyl-carrier protein] synthase
MSTNLWSPFAEENFRDPYAMYKTLRDTDPVYLAQTKEFIITRYDHVREVLKSKAFETGNRLEWLKRGIRYLENKDVDFSAIYDAINSFVLMLNPPQHSKIRSFVMQAWNNHQIDDIINQNIRASLQKINKPAFDVVRDFADPISIFTICDILGVAVNDYQYLKAQGSAMTKAVDLYPSLSELVRINEASKNLIAFFREHINKKLSNPDDGLLSKLIVKNNLMGSALSEPELISVAIFLFIAGQETTSSLISTGIHTFLKYPDQLKRIREDHKFITTGIEEILRYDSPVQLLGRMSREAYTLENKKIPPGSTLTLVIGSANRDERVFSQADSFVVDRDPNRHISFGSGIHFCLGDWLARREAQLAISKFFEKYENVRPATPERHWNKNLAVRSLLTLPVITG